MISIISQSFSLASLSFTDSVASICLSRFLSLTQYSSSQRFAKYSDFSHGNTTAFFCVYCSAGPSLTHLLSCSSGPVAGSPQLAAVFAACRCCRRACLCSPAFVDHRPNDRKQWTRGNVCCTLVQWSTQTLHHAVCVARNIFGTRTMYCVWRRAGDGCTTNTYHTYKSCTHVPFMWGSLRLAPIS